LEPQLAEQVQRIYEDGKESIWAELTTDFMQTVLNRKDITTRSSDRTDYILHPDSGERLSDESIRSLEKLRIIHRDLFDVQIVISDGLNAHSIMDEGHLLPFISRLRSDLRSAGFDVATENILVTSGRVRAGYRIGEALFGKSAERRSLLHIIGERPGTGHHTFSVYITSTLGSEWSQPDKVDHNITKVVSGIANTALLPSFGADETVRILKSLAA
jgi:ethanolamine ammonia-lyase large subunit